MYGFYSANTTAALLMNTSNSEKDEQKGGKTGNSSEVHLSNTEKSHPPNTRGCFQLPEKRKLFRTLRRSLSVDCSYSTDDSKLYTDF